jgi:Pro-kumamolisin, activation domain/Bacterial Ig-like domain (group 3)
MRACRFHSAIAAALILSAAVTIPSELVAQASGISPAASGPPPLITQSVNESQLTVLKGNTHRLARPVFDLGIAPATLPMQRMLLVLKRSPEQEIGLQKLLDNQQDKSSPSYKKWLTPTQFGQQFGPSDSDIQTITLWLKSHGFQVGSTKGRALLEFSGSASQVQETFHTSIHRYLIKGEQHWANSTDPSIPTALTPAVAGVLTLHNFLSEPQIHYSPQPVPAKIVSGGPGEHPQVTFPAQNGQQITYALGPQDYATIYNINPVYDNDANNGQLGGQTPTTIGVIGRSNLYNAGADIEDFRNSAFGLCCGSFAVILNGPDPGDLGGGEEFEATLDSTWSGAVAPGATVDLVVSASTNTTDGIDLSENYIVENNLADVMTESFSSCEAYATDTYVSGAKALAEQAAAQGITYVVSAGDDGAEGCDDEDTETVASGPLSVNLLASTPFTVAVGGTQFNENSDYSQYWTSATPLAESAISYIPEDVWNANCVASTCGSDAGILAGSGGISSGNTTNGGTFTGFAKPSWQTGVTGIPSGGNRAVPDVALVSAGLNPYILCLEGSCEPNSQNQIEVYFVYGTSAAAPSFSGIMALVDQQMANLNPAQGLRQGQANYVLYRLAASEALSQCNASSTSALPATSCIFNDVTVGNNAVPGEANYGSSTADYQSGVGYDMATGLGSVNVANLVSQWQSVTFNPTTTTLSVTSGPTLVHGTPLNFTAVVAPNSGTGTPTGDIALLATFQAGGSQGEGFFTLSSGSVASNVSGLPGGTITLTAQYAGDTTFAPSTSAPSSTLTITPEPSTTKLSVLTLNSSQTSWLNFTGGPFGSFVYLRGDVAGNSGAGVPTGSVNFLDNGTPLTGATSLALNSQGNTATPNGIVFDTGAHSISASYSGDSSFNASTTSPIGFTIQPGFFAAVPQSAASVTVTAPGASGTGSVSVSSSTGFSGTITLACTGLPAGAACVFSPASITAPGTLSTTTSAITVTTTAPATTMLSAPRPTYFAQWMTGFSFLFSVMIAGIPAGISKVRRKPRMLPGLTLLLLIALLGCGGGSHSTPVPPTPPIISTPAGNYTVGVTATSGSTTSSASFALTVQ